ncbi:MAG: hypothetical protein COB08_013195 [Rhodobacteraceae bacterium]|nr:hypothetical protein [Paracoccaceae bacterium]
MHLAFHMPPAHSAPCGYGGVVTKRAPSTISREEVFAKVEAETGAEFVHPYSDPWVIARQATCNVELIEQVDGRSTVADLAATAQTHGPQLEYGVEIDVGPGCCAASTSQDIVNITAD